MGIYWVYFVLQDASKGEMRLTEEARTRDEALKAATNRAKKMHCWWTFVKVEAVR